MYGIQVSQVYSLFRSKLLYSWAVALYYHQSLFYGRHADLQQDSNLQTLIRSYVIHVIIAHKRNDIPSSTRDTVGHIFFSTNQDKGYAAVCREYGLNQLYELLNLRIR